MPPDSVRVYARNGAWYYDLRLPGRERERRSCGPSREKAIEAAQRRLAELTGEPAAAPVVSVRTAPGSTLREILDGWVEHLKELHPRKPNTWKSADVAAKPLLRHLDPGGRLDARRLRSEDLVRYGAKRRSGAPTDFGRGIVGKNRKPVSDATIHRELGALRSALRWAVKRRWLREMPCDIPMPRVVRKQKQPLRPEQVERLLLLAHEPRIRALLALGFFAGLRRDEALHLEWRNIDLDPERGCVRVAAVGDWSPKNHQERAVPLHPRLGEELERWRAACPEGPWVFASPVTRANPDGRWTSPDDDLRTVFRAFAKAEGVRPPRNHYHWLRGSFVTDLIVGQGVDVVTATALGGWSDPGVVFRHYAATDPDRMRAAILKLGRKAS